MAKTKKRKTRTRYTEAKRSEILAAAKTEGLTAKDVQKKFGVTPVTYYSWRKKSGAGKKRGPRKRGARPDGLIASGLRGEVQARVRAILPGLVQAEVSRYLDAAFGSKK